MSTFHYAFKVKNISTTRAFYVEIMGCNEGRSTEHWIDFDFFGHQLSAHISKDIPELDYCGKVDELMVPIPHFGCILACEDFLRIQNALEKNGVQFIVKPQLRYAGKTGEQWTMFFCDFSNNPIELKSYTNTEEVFI